jgi:hypothetical protein
MNYYLIYWEGDGSDRESYSVFYCHLISAISAEEAWKIWDKASNTREGYNIRGPIDPLK